MADSGKLRRRPGRPRAAVDLVAAAGAVGDDQIVGAFAAGGSRPRFRLRRGYLTTKEAGVRGGSVAAPRPFQPMRSEA